MKIFRDPIHNVIDLDTGDKQSNALIISLINSRSFQRLRMVKQLGLANYAYPSANHSRFEHSLGVAYLAKRFLDKLLSKEELILEQYKDKESYNKFAGFFSRLRKDRIMTILAALLHDVGHGPLSHVSETLTDVMHEHWVREMILGETDINRILSKHNKHYPQQIWDILSNNPQNPMPTAKLISGQLDIDKIDYLLRDAYMTGSGYGKFDMEWLINVITVGLIEGNVEIGLDISKGMSVAEAVVIARINMFKNVYLHKVSNIAQKMLQLLFARIKEIGEDVPFTAIKNLYFSGLTKTNMGAHLADYLDTTDIEFNYFLKHLTHAKDPVLKNLAEGLIYRQFFKQVSKEIWEALQVHISQTKGEAVVDYYTTTLVIEDKKGGLMYQPNKDQIFLFDKSGAGFDLAEKSAIINTSTHVSTGEVAYFVDRIVYEKINKH